MHITNGAQPYLAPDQISIIGVVGTGAVGASWIALFLARGLTVLAHDPARDAEKKVRESIRDAWPSLMAMLDTPELEIPEARLRFMESVEEVVMQADAIQENTPERPDVKARVVAAIDDAASPKKIIMSSTGGIPPSELQKACKHPERFVVVHPFNPAHLIPLVEVVAGKETAPEVADWAASFSRLMGKHPIRLKREAAGHMTNRLQFALLREAVHCLVEDIATASDIDDAVRYGLGPRWAMMGGLLTMHMAGGLGGMKGILDHAGDAIEGWWSALGQPRLDAPTREKLLSAASEVAHGRSIKELVQWRDHNLARVVKLLQQDEEAAAQEFKN